MDFNKLKDFAKTAVNKTVDGVNKANDLRKKASQEVKLTLPASNSLTSATTIRKTIDGQYYLGFYSEEPTELFEYAGFEYAGSTITEKTTTKGTTTQKGRAGSVLGGAALGTLIAPGVGTLVGGMAGGSRKKKAKIDTSSITTSHEKPGKATIILRDINTGVLKTITTKLTQAEANNVQNFFS